MTADPARDERMHMIDAMTDAERGQVLAWMTAEAPEAFDAAVAARSATFADELADRIDDLDEDDEPQAYCTACGKDIGLFIGHEGWHHFRGEGTAASPVELYDAAHAPVVGWRWPDGQ
jgi:hypothetical protein